MKDAKEALKNYSLKIENSIPSHSSLGLFYNGLSEK